MLRTSRIPTSEFAVTVWWEPMRPAGTSLLTMRIQVALLHPKLTIEQEKMMLEQKLKQMEQEQPKK